MTSQSDQSPKLLQRDDAPAESGIAFAFDHQGARRAGLVKYDALEWIDLYEAGAMETFDQNEARILAKAAKRVDAGELDAHGRAVIEGDALDPVAE